MEYIVNMFYTFNAELLFELGLDHGGASVKITFLRFIFLISLILYSVSGLASASLLLSTDIPAAQSHCSQDEIVWLNLKNDKIHLKDTKWFGKTKRGAYVCKKEALFWLNEQFWKNFIEMLLITPSQKNACIILKYLHY